ncbi:MAG: endonuclease III [Clostridia bacterium]|nr:endonuclease III [Clostridia bacterium]
MNRKTAAEIIERLAGEYPDARPALEYENVFQLLVAVTLSAQCTDERVNKVTRELFKDYDTPEKFLSLSAEELGQKIYSCGLYRSKAEHILSACRDICEKFGGEVPRTREELMTLAGVGRKTANVVFSVGCGGDAIAVDTHVFRVANRIGLASAKDATKTEKQLMEIIEKSRWSASHHYLIYHGRRVCKAQRPMCKTCVLGDLCDFNRKNGD